MELLPAFVLCTILLCSSAQSPPSVASADCHETEKDAGVALDLINKHRRDGYIFSLLRVADAHVQHVENASIFYFILDVLETECPVLSRKHWETCEYGPFFGTSDFGRCNAVVYIDQALQGERLYGYNCTMSPVPPKLYECKRCPVRITVLENVQQYGAEAERILEQYIQESNETKHFKVARVTKALLGVADRTTYYVEFTIKETTCSKNKLPSSVSGCKFLPDREAHTGFCIGKVLNGTKDLDGVEVESCEIYESQLGRHPIHGHPHNDTGESHPYCNVCGHRGRDHWHRRHHHHHPDHHRPCSPHHHHHRPPHNDTGERHPPSNVSEHKCHHPWHIHHHHPDDPRPCRPHHHHHHHHHSHHSPPPRQHHHCPDCPHHHPPYGHHRDRHSHGHHPCGSAGPVDRSNSSKESQEKVYPDIPPPPGRYYPPPPPGGPHHFPPSKFPPPPAGPPPPPHRHHHPEGPDFRPPPRSPCGRRHGHHHEHRWNDTLHKNRENTSSKDHESFQSPHSFLEVEVASVYRVPLASERDVLQAPGADFIFPSHDKYEKAVARPFPLTPSDSESCPGKPTIDPPFDLLSLYPPPLTR
ncbi:histidine-rich glycoprotein [Heteronotia binoei]|uniref:histidine-rich glycoprotein n=1 Tax=Heteronotia binoei TaxID=13085 RepID=UPI00292E552A|nr:histidine-rich glycoprotein [Heteronotia binoei]